MEYTGAAVVASVASLQILLAALAGWLSGRQQDVIRYLVEENRVLRVQLRGHRLRLTDDQRRRLAVRGHRLGRAALRQVATIVTPDTILRWHRHLIARKWTHASKRLDVPARSPGLRPVDEALELLETGIRSEHVEIRVTALDPDCCRFPGERHGDCDRVYHASVVDLFMADLGQCFMCSSTGV